MEEENFKKLFQKIVNCYELAPEVARELLNRILEILNNTKDESSQPDSK